LGYAARQTRKVRKACAVVMMLRIEQTRKLYDCERERCCRTLGGGPREGKRAASEKIDYRGRVTGWICVVDDHVAGEEPFSLPQAPR